MCWSFDPDGSVENFGIDIGAFTMRGPAVKDFACYTDLLCELRLTGVDFAITNRARVQPDGGPLGYCDPSLPQSNRLPQPSPF